MSYCSQVLSATVLLVFGLASAAFGQLQWNSYDTSGNLVKANVATGGDVTSGTSVTFTVPANTRMFFITKSFTPIVLAQQNASAVVTFKFSASGGVTGVAQKVVEWGLYNSLGTASLADDMGMFGGWTGQAPLSCFTQAGQPICLPAPARVRVRALWARRLTARPTPTRFDYS